MSHTCCVCIDVSFFFWKGFAVLVCLGKTLKLGMKVCLGTAAATGSPARELRRHRRGPSGGAGHIPSPGHVRARRACTLGRAPHTTLTSHPHPLSITDKTKSALVPGPTPFSLGRHPAPGSALQTRPPSDTPCCPLGPRAPPECHARRSLGWSTAPPAPLPLTEPACRYLGGGSFGGAGVGLPPAAPPLASVRGALRCCP